MQIPVCFLIVFVPIYTTNCFCRWTTLQNMFQLWTAVQWHRHLRQQLNSLCLFPHSLHSHPTSKSVLVSTVLCIDWSVQSTSYNMKRNFEDLCFSKKAKNKTIKSYRIISICSWVFSLQAKRNQWLSGEKESLLLSCRWGQQDNP